jgi:hypothetical protein
MVGAHVFAVLDTVNNDKKVLDNADDVIPRT